MIQTWLISLKKSIPPFDITLGSSITLNFIIYGAFFLTLIACWLNSLNVTLQTLLSVGTAGMFLYTYQGGVLSYRNVAKLHCKSDGCWSLFNSDGSSDLYRLKETSVILGPLYFLHFQSKSKSINLILANDCMTAEEKRNLRVALKVYRKKLLFARV